MKTSLSAQLGKEWRTMSDRYAPEVRQAARTIAVNNATSLATHFYDEMLQDYFAAHFLSHELVKTTLHKSMCVWTVKILDIHADTDIKALVDEQDHIGKVHARIGVPVHVVLRGARALKNKYMDLAGQADLAPQISVAQVLSFIDASIDFAMAVMARAYASSQDRNTRTEESYRLFSIAQNVAAEKEHQRSMLLDWESRVMYGYALSTGASQLPSIGESDFGLWFKHKGAHVFQGNYETQVVLDAMTDIDTTLLPALSKALSGTERAKREQNLRDLHAQSRKIIAHLERLFEQRNELEAGRDVLTRLLSRRFLDVILSKEVTYARTSGTVFALLAIDIDYFKEVNDTYGHEAGDMVLQQFALLLNEHTRGGDYIFRLGGEEFLILYVDIKRDAALYMAEKLRQRVAKHEFRVRDDVQITITISSGLALHDGHPDHSRILRRADDALYRAKNGGRNRVVMAQSTVEASESASFSAGK